MPLRRWSRLDGPTPWPTPCPWLWNRSTPEPPGESWKCLWSSPTASRLRTPSDLRHSLSKTTKPRVLFDTQGSDEPGPSPLIYLAPASTWTAQDSCAHRDCELSSFLA